MKITYLFTTFPLLSERFLQREIEAMRELGVELELFSLFGGENEFQGVPVKRFRVWQWAAVPFAAWREYRRRPEVFRRLARDLRAGRPAGTINRLENLLGFAFAVVWAQHFRRTGEGRSQLHAVWATAPAAAALLIGELTGSRFTMGAHAYDVFRDGGDWLLERKLGAARMIHTSTDATRRELLRRGADEDRVVMIRRGLMEFPEVRGVRRIEAGGAVRLLTVGRLVEKKGFDDLLRICAALKEAGVPFECRVVGGGALRGRLLRLRRELGLEKEVEFVGPQPYEAVAELYRWADLFCFTGRVARSNDRDGLPNVLGEAMAYGLPVLSALVSGTVEAVADGETGFLLDPAEPKKWVETIAALRLDEVRRETLGRSGRSWVETHFDARENAKRLRAVFLQKIPSGEGGDRSLERWGVSVFRGSLGRL